MPNWKSGFQFIQYVDGSLFSGACSNVILPLQKVYQWTRAYQRFSHSCFDSRICMTFQNLPCEVALRATTPRLTSVGDAAAQAVRVLSVAQAVDEGSQLMHVVHFSSHHHLLVDHVGLRQVRSLLQEVRNKATSAPSVHFQHQQHQFQIKILFTLQTL